MTVKLSGKNKEVFLMNNLKKNGWKYLKDKDAICKNFEFNNFIEAFAWMTKVAIYAEKINHHPEWSNVYKSVKVILTTHDCGGLSDLDLKMAEKIEEFMNS